MASRAQSFERLRLELWQASADFKKGVMAANATVQSAVLGHGRRIHDEYAVVILRMPPGLTPEQFLIELASDLNAVVDDVRFDLMNRFHRDGKEPKVGELVKIDIFGPDDGAVILAEMGEDYFIYQTVTTPCLGTHPEYGAREFGFERRPDGSILLYTRGVSRPGDAAVGRIGGEPQRISWTSLVEGLARTIVSRGGEVRTGILEHRAEEGPHFEVAPYWWPGRP